jgi:hypothetical protein
VWACGPFAAAAKPPLLLGFLVIDGEARTYGQLLVFVWAAASCTAAEPL